VPPSARRHRPPSAGIGRADRLFARALIAHVITGSSGSSPSSGTRRAGSPRLPRSSHNHRRLPRFDRRWPMRSPIRSGGRRPAPARTRPSRPGSGLGSIGRPDASAIRWVQVRARKRTSPFHRRRSHHARATRGPRVQLADRGPLPSTVSRDWRAGRRGACRSALRDQDVGTERRTARHHRPNARSQPESSYPAQGHVDRRALGVARPISDGRPVRGRACAGPGQADRQYARIVGSNAACTPSP